MGFLVVLRVRMGIVSYCLDIGCGDIFILGNWSCIVSFCVLLKLDGINNYYFSPFINLYFVSEE